MKIAFYSNTPLTDKKNWSGTIYKMYEQFLRLGFEVIWIKKIEFTAKEQKKFTLLEKVYNKIFNRGYNKHLFYLKAKIAAKKLQNQLEKIDYDLFFVPTYVNDTVFLKIKKPIVYLNDANIGQLLNYYPYYSGFGILSKIETKYLEKKALKNYSKIIYSSDWAADYALKNYGIDKNKVEVIKFGANLEVPKNWTFNKEFSNKIIFLFLAVDWERKRGELAYKSLKILKDKGYNVELLILGCNPDIEEDWVKIIPFLNKNEPSELKQIQEYLLSSHFLFVPTKADCTPIAFCEAAGYGLPIITTNTGGVSAHVENNKTGILLSDNASELDYAHKIEKLFTHDKIKEISIQSRMKYENELNWDTWGNNFLKLIKGL
ncbi:glycosyltransferase family 4 protein [Empedobacter brevis]|uniref:glycosyltransferase family 4 protein n=1 Tax=Empedobacter brevis TaxID=247 RepID=UPI0039B0970A